jgi:hypothetical protein
MREVRNECDETIRSADILDDDRARVLIRLTVAVLYRAIEARVYA